LHVCKISSLFLFPVSGNGSEWGGNVKGCGGNRRGGEVSYTTEYKVSIAQFFLQNFVLMVEKHIVQSLKTAKI